MTHRQKKFRAGDADSANDYPNISGSESPALPELLEWVKQAVDEIAQLKILESLSDCEKPSTMVLTTGNVAEVEFSCGFIKMLVLALQKG